MKNLAALFLAFCAFFYSHLSLAGDVAPSGNIWTKTVLPAGSVQWSTPGYASKALDPRMVSQTLKLAGPAVEVSGSYNLGFQAGKALVNTKGLVTGVKVLSTVGSVLGGPVGAVLTGLFVLPGVLDWLLQAGVKPASEDATHGKPFEMLDGNPVVSDGTEYQVFGSAWYPSKQTACQARADVSGGSANNLTVVVSGENCTLYYKGVYDSSYSFFRRSSSCPVGSYISSSGICSNTQPVIPAIFPDFQQKLSGVPVSTTLINSLLDAGYTFPLDAPSVTGPASVTGPSTTSSTNSTSSPTSANPSGESITTNTTSTPVSDLTYSNTTNPATGQPAPTVTSTTTVTTTTTVINNTTNVTNTTTTVDTKPESQSLEPVEPSDLCKLHPEIVACATVDQVDMCKLYPESLACQKIDEPDVPDLEKLDKPITFTPDSGWGGSPGSCPAPRHMVSGTGADFSFQPYCDFMSALRPVFIAVAWLAGAMILIGANRKE